MRSTLETRQAWIYLAAVLAGLLTGHAAPAAGPALEPLIWPLLGTLLYATFTQVPLTRMPATLRDPRFLVALATGNFLLLPLVVGGLLPLLPNDPALHLGVLLVLLAPCTDWFVAFTHLGRGDTIRAIVATPLLLLGSVLALPVWLWLWLDPPVIRGVLSGHLLIAFALLIATPLLLAAVTERLAESRAGGRRFLSLLGRAPVPLLALIVYLIATSQVVAVIGMLESLWRVVLVFALFLLAAAWLGKWLGRWMGLPASAARTLTFSFGTRNSFVVLPLALALPPAWQAAAVVIVLQSLVELFGMIGYLAWVPRRLIPDERAPGARPD